MVVDVEYRETKIEKVEVELVQGQRKDMKIPSLLPTYRHLLKSPAVICVSH
jgi:hypothetical protein